MRHRRRIKKRFYVFLVIINLILISVFCTMFFKEQISGFMSGMSLNKLMFWKNDTAVVTNWEETTPAPEETEPQTDVFESRMSELQGNTIIGINYSGIGDDPQSLANHADRIVRVKVKGVKVTAYNNVVHSEITGKVKQTYKGVETDDIQIFAFGGTVAKADLKSGQIKETAGKTDETGDSVNVLMDFCEPIEEGEEYIIFATNNDGILSPVSGNMSFFKVDGRTVTRLSSENAAFTMKLGDFEKNYLE